MTKLWLTDQAYTIWGYLFRIGYWLGAIWISTIYIEAYETVFWYRYGLGTLCLLFVVCFFWFGRFLDHIFRIRKKLI